MKHQSKIEVWDLCLRLFHFLLMLLIIGSIVSAKLDRLDVHQYFGIMILGLLCFRILWGLFGTYYSTFKSFVISPHAVYLYISGQYHNQSLRNPLGSYSVVTFIIVIFFLVISGLFSSDDVMYDGPLVYLTPNYVFHWTKMHNVLHFVLYGLIILHLTAVFYYQYLKKHQIIQQIFDGYARNINFKPRSIKEKYVFKGISFLLIFLSLPVIILWYF